MLSFLIAARSRLLTRPRQRADRGATAVEYSLIVSLIAAVIIGAVFLLGEHTDALFTAGVDAFTTAGISGSAD